MDGAMSPSPSTPTGTYSAGGAVDIRDTDYPIPAGAYFVAVNGSDSAAGGATTPWRTIGHAVAAAPSGSTIVIHGGTYREGSITLYGKRLTLQPYPHEKVWLNGSLVVSNWVASGNAWRSDGWNPQFAQDTPSQAIDPNYPMAPYRDMVFVDGRALRRWAACPRYRRGHSTPITPTTGSISATTRPGGPWRPRRNPMPCRSKGIPPPAVRCSGWDSSITPVAIAAI